MDVMESLFSKFTTEWKFDKELRERDLMAPIVQCIMLDGNDDDGTAILMPLRFQIKKFLELPGVFQKIQENTANITQQGKLTWFH